MCKNNDQTKCCCINIPIKRWFLPFIGVVFLFFYEEIRNEIYLPIITSVCAFIIFWNFPFIVYKTASRPLYYEDLFIDEKKLPNYDVDETIKRKFKCILTWVLIVTNTILAGALSEYWFYKLNGNFIHSWMEIIGVTGGIIKIFQIANNTIVKYMLKILRHYVREENKQYNLEQVEKIQNIIQLKKIGEKDIFLSHNENKIVELCEIK